MATLVESDATRVRALQLSSMTDTAVAATCLSDAEQRLMATYRHPRRRLEFLAGRMALKQALLDTEGSAVRIGFAQSMHAALRPALLRMQALPDGDGRPTLWLDEAIARTQVSIAHSSGWAAAACSRLPIGIDVVDIEASNGVADDDPWLVSVGPEGRVRLRALLWGLRECLLKSGQIAAKTVWDLGGVHAAPTCAAEDVIARWPREAGLMPFEVRAGPVVVPGAFVALSKSIILVVVSSFPQ